MAFRVAPLTTRSVPTGWLYSTASSSATVQSEMDGKLSLLKSAAETKQEDSDDVVAALLDLEKLSRQAAKIDESYAEKMLQSLNGSWRLVFTTGTVNTQKNMGKINYFPLKAVQSFDTTTMKIENGIYLGDFCALKFSGDFSFDLKKRKLEFDFDNICVLQTFDVKLKKGESANLGAKSGLGSESNVANAAKDKSAFFNWISADEAIATARGGGGGLALWKRVVE
eukprot:scaffold771_cov170-Amphora_coffeaeformis.AAC.7